MNRSARLAHALACLSLFTTACKSHAPQPDESPFALFSPGSWAEDEPFDTASPPSLPRALALASKHAPGRALIHAELWQSRGQVMCLAVFLGAERFKVVQIEGDKEAPVVEGDMPFTTTDDTSFQELVKRATSIIGPERAIAAATSSVPRSWAVGIDLEELDSEPVFTVHVVNGTEERRVLVSARDGTLLVAKEK